MSNSQTTIADRVKSATTYPFMTDVKNGPPSLQKRILDEYGFHTNDFCICGKEIDKGTTSQDAHMYPYVECKNGHCIHLACFIDWLNPDIDIAPIYSFSNSFSNKIKNFAQSVRSLREHDGELPAGISPRREQTPCPVCSIRVPFLFCDLCQEFIYSSDSVAVCTAKNVLPAHMFHQRCLKLKESTCRLCASKPPLSFLKNCYEKSAYQTILAIAENKPFRKKENPQYIRQKDGVIDYKYRDYRNTFLLSHMIYNKIQESGNEMAIKEADELRDFYANNSLGMFNFTSETSATDEENRFIYDLEKLITKYDLDL